MPFHKNNNTVVSPYKDNSDFRLQITQLESHLKKNQRSMVFQICTIATFNYANQFVFEISPNYANFHPISNYRPIITFNMMD